MRELDEFAVAAIRQRATIQVHARRSENEDFLRPDALLQTPLIALCLLVAGRSRRKGLATGQIATLASAILATYFRGLGNAQFRLGWAPEMRLKSAEALAELEALKLVVVNGTPRRFSNTPAGNQLVDSALREPRNEVGRLARGLEQACDNVDVVEGR